MEEPRERWVEVIAKAAYFPGAQEARDTIRVGDVVRFEGTFQDGARTLLTCLGFEVVRRWRDAGGGAAFKLRAPPHREHGAKHQAAGGGGEAAGGRAQQQGQEQQQGNGTAADGAAAAPRPGNGAAPAAAPAAAAATGDGAGAAAGAAVAGPQLPLCKFFVNSGSCWKGAACPYAHVVASARGAALTSWVRRRRTERRANAEREGCAHAAGAPSKRHRARIFAQWLVNTYGRDALNTGAGVLDVAGGRGAVTFELVVTHGVKCTLVEPRPFKLSKLQHKTLKGLGVAAQVVREAPPPGEGGGEPAGAGAAAGGAPAAAAGAAPVAAERTPADAVAAAAAAVPAVPAAAPAAGVPGQAAGEAWEDNEKWWATEEEQRRQDEEEEEEEGEEGEAGGAGANGGSSSVSFRQVQAFFGPELWRGAWWRARGLHECSLIVGQHPDEATELILDYALAAGGDAGGPAPAAGAANGSGGGAAGAGSAPPRPFAVMPCCVFPRRFPWRRRWLADGSEAPVVTYLELVDYLLQKGGPLGASEVALPFVGCNRVVWAPGGGAADGAAAAAALAAPVPAAAAAAAAVAAAGS
ncbi:MAG: hypothetical protein J3K34DRAFT_520358 [Monoraphidium minutum]|nr:MAG: hypothetical protein J3K34DRAFT_520358 [Monoraphidium minutum]